MMRGSLLLSCALVLAVAGAGSAQSPPVSAGDRVRISAPAVAGTYTVVAVETDGMLLRTEQDAAAVRVPTASLERLHVSRGRRSPGAGMWRGAGLGLIAGAIAGGAMGLASGDDTNCFICWSKEEKAVMGMIGVGGTAALVGGVIGRAAPGETWERIPLPARLTVAPAPDGRASVAVSVRFQGRPRGSVDSCVRGRTCGPG